MSDASLSAILNFIAPGNEVPGNTPITCVSPYSSVALGTIDIPAATAADVEFVLSFGSVASPTLLLIKNTNESDIGIRFQAEVGNADEFQLAPGGVILIAMPVVAAANPLTAAAITTSAIQVADGSVSYLIFGDP